MKIVRFPIKLETHRETIELALVGDVHLGHKNVEYNYLESIIDYIKARPKCFWIGMGDFFDSITVKDRRFSWDSIDMNYRTPNDQLQKAIQLFKPIANQCVTLLTGNHEYKLWQEQGSLDFTNALCTMLSTDEHIIPYGTYDAIILLQIEREGGNGGSRFVKIYSHHGWTSSRTEGGLATRLSEMIDIFPVADVYAMGHTHRLGLMPLMQQLDIASVNNKDTIVHRNIYRVLTGGFLRGYVDNGISYEEIKTYPPAGLGSPLLEIQPFRGGRNQGEYLDIRYKRLPDDLP